MTKILWIGCLVIASASMASAQSYEGTIDYQKTQQPVATIQLPHSRDYVEDALKEYMAKRGAKNSSVKSFTVYRSVKLTETDTASSDLYFITASKNRNERDVTVLTLLPAHRNQDLSTRTAGEKDLLVSARLFLDSLAPYIAAYSLQQQSDQQEALLKKAQKKMNGLVDDQSDLDKKIRKLQSSIEENKQAQTVEAAALNDNVKSDDASKKKNQKKLSKLMDEEADLAKRLRRAQSDLDQNKIDQRQQQAEVDKQSQMLAGIKSKQAH